MLESQSPGFDCYCHSSTHHRASPCSSCHRRQLSLGAHHHGSLPDNGPAGGSLRLQGLQTSGRRPSSPKVGGTSLGRGGINRHSDSRCLRLPRRVRLRTKYVGGRQACQRRARSQCCNSSSGNFFRRVIHSGFLLLVVFVTACSLVDRVQGFGVSTFGSARQTMRVGYGGAGRRRAYFAVSRMSVDDSEDVEREEDIGEDLDTGGVIIDDLTWRVEKLRLEEENKRRFLKAGPRFLPYTECRKWVQAWGSRWESEEEWNYWIGQGEKRNSYIPSCPDVYYGRLGQWISWEHFLGTEGKEDVDEMEDKEDL